MGNIINDIVEEIEIKPKKSKLIIKWVISVSISLIGIAFVLGQFKASFFNRMDRFEETLNKNTASIEQLKTDINAGFDNVDVKIDKVYDDALVISDDYREYNRKQLELVVDYGQENKEMLKRMLELNAFENKQNIANQVAKARNEDVNSSTYQGSAEFSAVEEGRNLSIVAVPMKDKPFMSEVFFIEVESQDTTFSITGATRDYVSGIDKNKYELGAIIESDKYPGRYDFSYRKKQ